MIRVRTHRPIFTIPTEIVITSVIAITGVPVLVRLIAAEKVLNRCRVLRVTTIESFSASYALLSVSIKSLAPTSSSSSNTSWVELKVSSRYVLLWSSSNEKLLSKNEKSLSEGTIDSHPGRRGQRGIEPEEEIRQPTNREHPMGQSYLRVHPNSLSRSASSPSPDLATASLTLNTTLSPPSSIPTPELRWFINSA